MAISSVSVGYSQRNVDGFASARSSRLVNYLSRATRGNRNKVGVKKKDRVELNLSEGERETIGVKAACELSYVCTTNAQTNTSMALCVIVYVKLAYIDTIDRDIVCPRMNEPLRHALVL